jgi:hypothetical protein
MDMQKLGRSSGIKENDASNKSNKNDEASFEMSMKAAKSGKSEKAGSDEMDPMKMIEMLLTLLKQEIAKLGKNEESKGPDAAEGPGKSDGKNGNKDLSKFLTALIEALDGSGGAEAQPA